MKNSSTLFFIILFIHTFLGFSQELEFGKPVKFGSQINSNGEEINPIMSSDGKTLYFVRAFHPKNTGGQFAGSDIWVANRNGRGQWLASSNKLKKWNNRDNNSVIGISKDHSRIYLLNAYSKKIGISFSNKVSSDWTEPQQISIPGINSKDFVGFYINPDQDVLLISMNDKSSIGQEDIYVSLKDSLNNWSPPLNIGSAINTEGFEISPFLSQDKKRLYFSSDGHSGFGDADVYVSERLYESWTVWSKPRNLGKGINSEKFDSYFSIYGDSIAYFSSNRDSELSDIYQVKVGKRKPEALTPKDEIAYLSDEEIRKFSTKSYQNTITFTNKSTELSSLHKDQLNTLVNILIRNKDLRVRALIKSTSGQEELERFQTRLLAILDYLKNSGVEGARISFGSDNSVVSPSALSEVVIIKLYR